MRYITVSLALLAVLTFGGCGTSSTTTVRPLTQSAAIGMAARYYNACGGSAQIGQCAVLNESASGMRPYIRIEKQVPVLTARGAKYAVDTIVRLTGILEPAGSRAYDDCWRLADVTVHPTSFSVAGDTATMRAVLVMTPTPLMAVQKPVQRPHLVQRVVHYKSYRDAQGGVRWYVVPSGSGSGD